MPTLNRTSIALVACAALITGSIQSTARGGVIGTQEYLTAVDREATIERIDAVLAREEVRSTLEHYGVDPADANERVAALTDQELQTLADDLEDLPAGGELLAVIGIAFIVILILE